MYYFESRAFKTIARAIEENSDCVNLSIAEAAYFDGMVRYSAPTGDAYISAEDLQTLADAFSDIGDIRAIA